jgi:hypothetical protein
MLTVHRAYELRGTKIKVDAADPGFTSFKWNLVGPCLSPIQNLRLSCITPRVGLPEVISPSTLAANECIGDWVTAEAGPFGCGARVIIWRNHATCRGLPAGLL